MIVGGCNAWSSRASLAIHWALQSCRWYVCLVSWKWPVCTWWRQLMSPVAILKEVYCIWWGDGDHGRISKTATLWNRSAWWWLGYIKGSYDDMSMAKKRWEKKRWKPSKCIVASLPLNIHREKERRIRWSIFGKVLMYISSSDIHAMEGLSEDLQCKSCESRGKKTCPSSKFLRISFRVSSGDI